MSKNILVNGGVNEGTRVFADDKFMTFKGDIREMK